MFKVIKCNELNEKLIDKKVEINAWVKKLDTTENLSF